MLDRRLPSVDVMMIFFLRRGGGGGGVHLLFVSVLEEICTHNFSPKGAIKLKFVPFCSS